MSVGDPGQSILALHRIPAAEQDAAALACEHLRGFETDAGVCSRDEERLARLVVNASRCEVCDHVLSLRLVVLRP